METATAIMADKELHPLSKRLRELRTAAGLTRQELATRADLSMSLIVQVEQGQRNDIKLSTAAALADALFVPLDALLGRKPKRPRKDD